MHPPPPSLPFSAQARRGRRAWWRSLALLLTLVAAVLVANLLIIAVLSRSPLVAERGFDPTNFTPASLGLREDVFLLLVLLPFAAGLVTLLAGVKLLHRRAPSSLVYGARGRVRWGRMAVAAAAWTALLALGDVVGYLADPANYTLVLDLEALLPILPVVVALIPLQIAFEELSLRGYLHQELSAATGAPWLGVAASTLLFGALHFFNPEVRAFGLPAMATYYLGVGLFLAVLSVLDDGLELALGVHLATNLYNVLLVNYAGSTLPTSSLVRTDDVDVGLMLGLFAVQATLFATWALRRGGRGERGLPRWRAFSYLPPGPPDTE